MAESASDPEDPADYFTSRRGYLGIRLGDELRQARKRKRLGHKRLGHKRTAALVGIDVAYWKKLERGIRRPSIVVMERILKELGPWPDGIDQQLRNAAGRGVGYDGRSKRFQLAYATIIRRDVALMAAKPRRTERIWSTRCLIPGCPSRPFPEPRDHCPLGHTWNGP